VTAVRDISLWPQLRSPRFALFLLAVALTLVRARDLPAVDVGFGSTSAAVTPADLVLGALAVAAVLSLLRNGTPRAAWPTILAAAAFIALLLGTAAANGAYAFVSGVKLTELAALALAAIAFLRSRAQLEALADLLIIFGIAADIYAAVEFVANGGGRQPSFLGEHDFAALATLPVLYGLCLLYEGSAAKRAWTAIVVGSIGCVLGAALASLVGFYLGSALLMVVRAARRRLTLQQAVATLAVVAVVTAGTLTIRAGSLGFLQSWFGKPPSRPGQYASSWSQRLIYVYVGGRMFLAHPILGTGWWSDVPPSEWARYLPDARRHFSDQPPRYFPPADRPFIPQQTYDEILYELGLVGAAVFLALLVALGQRAAEAARTSADAVEASLPGAWLAASIGALAGEGLFGGTAVAATFWLTAGVIVALAPVRLRT
jgi:O-Antigen ligase